VIDLFAPGAYARRPGGNLERPLDQRLVVDWIAWNIGVDPGVEGNPGVWDECRRLWNSAGIQHFPWLHCRSLDDIGFLIDVGGQYGSPAIGLNIEDVVKDALDLDEVAGLVQDFWVNRYGKPVHMATLPWVQNQQGWHHLAFCVAALEIMPDEQTNIFPNGYDPEIVEDCIYHAFAEGLEKVTLMFKTKPPHSRAEYGNEFDYCHSLYTADDITPSREGWLAWVSTLLPCKKPKKEEQPVPPPQKEWYEKPYINGAPVGPDKLPRPLKPPSAQGGKVTQGDDVTAYKRAISRAGRLKPWSPSTWNVSYGEIFAMGDGSGNVGKTGVRGFQRQQFPNDKTMQTGNLGNTTYQALRRARVSDPDSPNFREPLFDAEAVRLLKKAAKEFDEDAIVTEFRKHLAEFCLRAENASTAAWTYTQARPFTGLGVAPELNHDNDCSSYVILAYFWARRESKLAVPDPSGYQYDGFGNTWDDLDGHPRVTSGSYLVGDLAHYNGHVTLCRKAGDKDTSVWSSFGAEPKPRPVSLHYRGDLLAVVRPPIDVDV
jgi:hypothetical protein